MEIYKVENLFESDEEALVLEQLAATRPLTVVESLVESDTFSLEESDTVFNLSLFSSLSESKSN